MDIQTPAAFWEKCKDRTNSTVDPALDQTVTNIIAEVRKNGDQALKDYTEKFDEVRLDSFTVTEQERMAVSQTVPNKVKKALQQAKQNIVRFHEAQTDRSWFQNDDDGNMLGQKITPLDRVGVYIPGGKASYPSTVLMNVIPAKLAGVPSISIVTPPRPDGSVDPYVLAAANEAGVDAIFKVGGAQAIAALAYGTESLEKVAKIVGPGNTFVARAKKWVFGDVAIDMIAGPSEICIVADETVDPKLVAADLLSQAEHDEHAQATCITTSQQLAQKVQKEINTQLISLERKAIIEQSLANYGSIMVVDTLAEAFELVNKIAPEHLQLLMQNPGEHVHSVHHAGAIFLGSYSPEALGDYLAGPNHTLPTNGTATFSSPLGVYDFVKKSSLIRYTESALLENAEHIIALAEAEGLTAHANAIRLRQTKAQ